MRLVLVQSYILLLWSSTSLLCGQDTFLSMHSVWDDLLTEWEIIVLDESDKENVITIEPRWPLRNDLQEWRVNLPEGIATISTKWRNDFTRWEMRINSEIYDISQKWRDDPNVWEIRNHGRRIQVETYIRDDANVWEVSLPAGSFFFYTEYRNDPRDWIIETEGLVDLSNDQMLAALFIGMFQSIPKT